MILSNPENHVLFGMRQMKTQAILMVQKYEGAKVVTLIAALFGINVSSD
jgi:hypothetical protein